MLIGFGIVVTNLKIPLLWIQISSSGLSKAEGKRKKLVAFRRVNALSVLFIITFILATLAMGTQGMTLLSTLWFIGFMFTYNYGGGRIMKQLNEKDRDGKYKPVVSSIKAYVMRFTVVVRKMRYIALRSDLLP